PHWARPDAAGPGEPARHRRGLLRHAVRHPGQAARAEAAARPGRPGAEDANAAAIRARPTAIGPGRAAGHARRAAGWRSPVAARPRPGARACRAEHPTAPRYLDPAARLA